MLHAEAAKQVGSGMRLVEGRGGQAMLDCWAELLCEQRAALTAYWQPMLQTPPDYDSKQQDSEANFCR